MCHPSPENSQTNYEEINSRSVGKLERQLKHRCPDANAVTYGH